jgi:predicted Zn-dependent protease
VQPIAENASAETIFANGMSAVRTGDLATAEKMADLLGAKAGVAPRAEGGGAHADHGPAPAAGAGGNPDAGKGDRVMAMELAALVAEAKGQKDQAIALLKDAVKIEESMRPPNGAADPVKPSHEVLGEVLFRAGQAKDAAEAFDASLLRMPNRARALMGAAQAHAAAGNAAAAAARHSTLMRFWKGKAPAAPTSVAVLR